jgi:mRNA interferase MazF
VVILRGAVSWADLGEPRGVAPGYRRPMLVVSADRFNLSAIRTVTVAVLTSNVRLASAPGNVLLDAGTAGLDRDSVVNVSALFTLDAGDLEEPTGRVTTAQLRAVDRGLRLALAL